MFLRYLSQQARLYFLLLSFFSIRQHYSFRFRRDRVLSEVWRHSWRQQSLISRRSAAWRHQAMAWSSSSLKSLSSSCWVSVCRKIFLSDGNIVLCTWQVELSKGLCTISHLTVQNIMATVKLLSLCRCTLRRSVWWKGERLIKSAVLFGYWRRETKCCFSPRKDNSIFVVGRENNVKTKPPDFYPFPIYSLRIFFKYISWGAVFAPNGQTGHTTSGVVGAIAVPLILKNDVSFSA